MGAPLAGGGDLEGSEALALVLASTSPQRRAILEQLRIPFEVIAPSYAEVGDDPVAHAIGKARSVERAGRLVLGVDTVVVLDDRVLGKPGSPEEAVAMLEALSGRTHEVVSGLCLRAGDREDVGREVTNVTFRTLSSQDIDAYLASGEWRDRAGAYAIQGFGASLVERIEGDYLNVVGLPAALLIRLLAKRGYPLRS